MSEKLATGRATQYLVTAAMLVIVIAGMRAAVSIIVPLLLAIFISLLCAPPVLWLQRKGWHTGLAVGLVVLLVISIGLAIGAVAGTSLSQFSVALPRYEVQLTNQMTALLGLMFGVVEEHPAELETHRVEQRRELSEGPAIPRFMKPSPAALLWRELIRVPED